MLEIVMTVSQGLALPLMAVVLVRVKALEASNRAVLAYLEKHCPHCGAIRIISADQ